MADPSPELAAASPESEVSAYRPLAFAIAYRMVGSVAETEDIVQEAFLRLHRARQDGVTVESPKAYLAALTTRLAIDHLRSARVWRESYVGRGYRNPSSRKGSPRWTARSRWPSRCRWRSCWSSKRCRRSSARCSSS